MIQILMSILVLSVFGLSGCSDAVFKDAKSVTDKAAGGGDSISGTDPGGTPPETVPPALDDPGKKKCWDDQDHHWHWRIPVCHLPAGDETKAKTLYLPMPAVVAHLLHGDLKGPCEGDDESAAPEGGDDMGYDCGCSDDGHADNASHDQ